MLPPGQPPHEQIAPTPVRRKRRRAPPQLLRDYLTKRELTLLVPLSLTTIDRLEQQGVFPSRFIVQPTRIVAWKRSEVLRFMEQRAAKRVHQGKAQVTK